jgi:histidine triad (HIT) family protein
MKTVDDCIFCKIVGGEIPCFKLFESDAVLAFMDINPFNQGHCLIIPKAHAANLYEADDSDLAACLGAAKRVAAAVDEVVAPDGINLIQANGAGAGQSVLHFHFHVFPRREGDDAKLNWSYEPGDMDEIGALATRIRAAIG